MQRNHIPETGTIWPFFSRKTRTATPNDATGLRGSFSSVGRVTLRAEPKGNDGNPETSEMHNQIEQPLSGRRRGASGGGHEIAPCAAPPEDATRRKAATAKRDNFILAGVLWCGMDCLLVCRTGQTLGDRSRFWGRAGTFRQALVRVRSGGLQTNASWGK